MNYHPFIPRNLKNYSFTNIYKPNNIQSNGIYSQLTLNNDKDSFKSSQNITGIFSSTQNNFKDKNIIKNSLSRARKSSRSIIPKNGGIVLSFSSRQRLKTALFSNKSNPKLPPLNNIFQTNFNIRRNSNTNINMNTNTNNANSISTNTNSEIQFKNKRKSKLLNFLRNTMKEKKNEKNIFHRNNRLNFTETTGKINKKINNFFTNNTNYKINYYRNNDDSLIETFGNYSKRKLKNLLNLKEMNKNNKKQNTVIVRNNNNVLFSRTFFTSIPKYNNNSINSNLIEKDNNNNNNENYLNLSLSERSEQDSFFKLCDNKNNSKNNKNLFSHYKEYQKKIFRDMKFTELMQEVTKFESSKKCLPNEFLIKKNVSNKDRFISKHAKKIQGFKKMLSKNQQKKSDIKSKLKLYLDEMDYTKPLSIKNKQEKEMYNKLNELQKISDNREILLKERKNEFSFDKTNTLFNNALKSKKTGIEDVDDFLKNETLDCQKNNGDFIYYKGRGMFAKNVEPLKKGDEVLAMQFQDMKKFFLKNLNQ